MNPKELKYTKDHEWISVVGKIAKVGVTEYAANQLGDVVFVQLPEVNSTAAKGKSIGVIESVKTVSDIFSPVSGKVTKVNSELETSPELINSSPFEEGWIAEIEFDLADELNDLYNVEEYEKFCTQAG